MRDRTAQLIAAVVMVCCLVASAFMAPSVAASAGRNRLVYGDTVEEGDPPEVALGIAMGAFRGLFVNILWIRANDRKQEGRYYDAVDLAKTITRLQPRFPRVWAFHAWNLAYNISVATNTPEERWNWVSQGIRLLRDEGIPKNPNDLLVHKELGWIFLHKVQGFMDDANGYYKRQHARDWTIVLGPPPRRDADHIPTEARQKQLVEWLTNVMNAKETLADVIAGDPRAQELVDRLRDEAGIDLTLPFFKDDGSGPGEQLLTLIEEQRSLGRVLETTGLRAGRPDRNAKAVELINNMELRPAFRLLALHVRKRVLVDKYHMEPDRMIRYTEAYGPLDWRHPASHALYWAQRGIENALSRATAENKRDFDFLNTDRLVVQAVQELFRTGDLYFDILNPQFYMTMPSVDYIPVYGDILEVLSKREAEEWESKGVMTSKTRPYQLYSAGYENFLKDAVRYLYRRGDLNAAQTYFDKLITYAKLNTNDPFRPEKFNMPLKEWVVKEISEEERFAVPNVALQEVVGSLQGAYLNGLLMGNMKLFRDCYTYAAEVHAVFVKRQVFNVAANAEDAARMEIFARDFPRVAGQVLAVLIGNAGLPDGPAMYQRAPDDLKARTYVLMERMNLRAYFEQGGTSFDVFFPPVPGIEEYRAQLDADDKARAGNKPSLEHK
jgi:hypothetical protein